MLNIAGYRIPLFSFKGHGKAYESSPKGGDEIDLDSVCFQSVYFDFEKRLTAEEKEKHEYFEKLGHGSNSHILANLLSDDILILTETEDELSRCGDFVRVFPSSHSSPYLQYFETTNYYNLLLDEWEKHFGQNRMEGKSFDSFFLTCFIINIPSDWWMMNILTINFPPSLSPVFLKASNCCDPIVPQGSISTCNVTQY